MKSRNPLAIELLRGPAVESVHHVMLVVADHRGLISGFMGNSDYVVYPRSSIKMLQAIPFLESGAFTKFKLDEKQVALACSSHRGEKQHLAVIQSWMEKIGASEDWLACGPDWPAHEGTRFEMVKKGLGPSRLLNNCSGKHLGMISTCLALGENFHGYEKWDHPVQARLRKVMAETTRINYERLVWGIDGCGIPTYAIPLQNLAIAMSSFLSVDKTTVRGAVDQALVDACTRHPQMVSGSETFSAALCERTNGRALLKTGAEGIYTGLMPEQGYAFALKVHDGAARAAEVASAFVFRAMGALSEAEYLDLKAFTMPELKNTRGEKVGEIRLQKGSP